ncbi:hypothetical protein AB0436_30425 [Streptomyces sp. NPDC051322]|uniref:hypothetical protein n=1 Tax=Streptomyces sp. NPDC051322 TaxID=3154645 RepID=UPI00344B424C
MRPPHDTRHLLHGLATLWPSYLAYALTFLLIGTVVLHGIAFELAAVLFKLIWWYARHARRLLATTIDSAGVTAISRRFRLGAGTLLGALLPALGVAVIAAFIFYYWLPIGGEIAKVKRRRSRGDQM